MPAETAEADSGLSEIEPVEDMSAGVGENPGDPTYPTDMPGPAGPGAIEPVETVEDLPEIDEAAKQIPAETRQLLSDLFRAKFVTVRRIPLNALKPGGVELSDQPAS